MGKLTIATLALLMIASVSLPAIQCRSFYR
jgi:hypothetical protein